MHNLFYNPLWATVIFVAFRELFELSINYEMLSLNRSFQLNDCLKIDLKRFEFKEHPINL